MRLGPPPSTAGSEWDNRGDEETDGRRKKKDRHTKAREKVDLAGNCRIVFDEVFIQKSGQRNPVVVKRDLRSLYSPRTTRVLRVLLENPSKTWRMQALANEASVSLGQVANVKKLLLDREWLVADEHGVHLDKPGELLSEWSGNYDFRRNQVSDFYTMRDLSSIEMELAGHGASSVLTGFSGAARVAPSVRYQRVMAYVKGSMEHITRRLDLKPVTSGANVTLLSPYDEGVFYGSHEVDGVIVVGNIQLYLDLKSYRGRGEEAAKALLEEVITPEWL